MNWVKYVGISLVALSLSSCGGGSNTEETAVDSTANESQALPAVLTRGTMLLDLSEYFMPFSVYVPDSNRGIPDFYDTGYGVIELTVGSTYAVMLAEGGNIAEKKQVLAADDMYKHEIIEEGTDYILYKSSLPDSPLEPEFHFYAVKHVNGVDYEIHDNDTEGGYAETVARFMLESIQHLKPNNSAI